MTMANSRQKFHALAIYWLRYYSRNSGVETPVFAHLSDADNACTLAELIRLEDVSLLAEAVPSAASQGVPSVIAVLLQLRVRVAGHDLLQHLLA